MSVPALRFKDESGQNFPDWKAKSISELAIKVIDGDRGQNYPNGNDFSDDGYCLFLNAKNVTKSGFAFEELSFITKEKDEQLRKGKLRKNDLIITTRGSVGNIAHFDNEVNYVNMRINSGMVILRNESTDISPNYLYQYFYSPHFTKSVQQIAFGSAQPQLTVLEIKKFIVGLPLIKEQTKIANFLTAIDEKITNLTKKHDLLTQYKKGVMQQIFNQELRFKDDDGQDFPEWEEVSLENVLDYEQPTKYLVSSTEYSDSFKTPVLTAGKTFILGYTDEINGICKEGLPVIIFDDFTTAFKFVSFPFKAKSSAMKLLRKKADVNIYYVYTAMQLIDFPSGDEHKRYWISEYSKVIIPLPCGKEQTKIANFLTAIDDKITATQTQLKAVKQYKQGLLQQMFV